MLQRRAKGARTLTLGLISSLMRGGIKEPNDISVIGYDEAPFAAYTYPALTTFRQNLDAITSSAVKLPRACADGNYNQKELLPDSLKFKPELVIRHSTRIRT